MIISMWLAYIAARKGVGASVPSVGALAIPAAEVGTVSLMERWLRKVKDGTSRLFRWTLAGAAVQRAEAASAPPACLAANGPAPQGLSLSHSLLEDRTTIHLLRRSQTRVCCVVSAPGDKAAQEGLEQMENHMSQLVLQAKLTTKLATKMDAEPDTGARVPLSYKD